MSILNSNEKNLLHFHHFWLKMKRRNELYCKIAKPVTTSLLKLEDNFFNK